jgi:hypothetical protein
MTDDDLAEEEETVSSAPSCPLRKPYIPDEIWELGFDDETFMAHEQTWNSERTKYDESSRTSLGMGRPARPTRPAQKWPGPSGQNM